MKKILIIVFIFICFPVSWFYAADQVDINTASLQQLDNLTGIGPTYAQRIIDGRPYSSVDDLLKVKGIGPATLQKIKDQGLACVNCETTQINPNYQNPTPTPTTTPAPEPTAVAIAIIYPTGIFINEILPNPEGSDETNEWIELYNSNNFDVDLVNWQIKDITGTVTTFTIPQNIPSRTQAKISANGFLIFKRPDTKISMNNDGDGLNLLTPDGKIVDSVNFTKAPLGQSYNKTNSAWAWSTTLTPGILNTINAAQTNNKSLSKTKNSVNNNSVDSSPSKKGERVDAGLADLTQTINTNQDNNKMTNPWFLFFTALVITIISASIVLFIKLKIKK